MTDLDPNAAWPCRHRRLGDADAVLLYERAPGWRESDRRDTGHVARGVEILGIDVLEHRERRPGLDRHAAAGLRAGGAGDEGRASRTHDAARNDRGRDHRETRDGDHEQATHLHRLFDTHMTDPLYPLESAMVRCDETRGIPVAGA